MLLKNAGAEIVGLTLDGATTNRTMWKNLGIDGKKGSLNIFFINPYNEKRKVFDAPHLIKTIRNRLHSKKHLRASIFYVIFIIIIIIMLKI